MVTKSLELLAEELIKIGNANPLDLRAVDALNLPPFPVEQHKVYSENNIQYHLQYSLDILSGDKTCRHVSVSRGDFLDIDKEILDKIVAVFFPNMTPNMFKSKHILHLIAIMP
jgi:hypothetical protein